MEKNIYENLKKKFDGPYIKAGATFFCAGLLLIIAYYSINHFPSIKYGWDKVNGILFPFYLGIVISYLLSPIYNWIVKKSYPFFKKKLKKPITALTVSRFVATVLTLIFLLAAMTGIVSMIIPGLYESITTLVPRMPDYFNSAFNWVSENLKDNPELANFLSVNMDNAQEKMLSWLQDKILPASETLVSNISLGVITTVTTLLNILVSIIICVYLLNSKEMFAAQSKKLILAILGREKAEKVFELGHITNNCFGGFINGKLIDSIIIGLLCFILMTIFQMPQTMLISVIVGVTNIIPFFGPFIGAVPSALLLLIISPIDSLKFIVLVFLLQQFDGNILGPKILGKSTKLASFWVMFAIIVGGGLFGILGMILGVPMFAVIYTYLSRGINNKLDRMGYPKDTVLYENFYKFGIKSEELFGKERMEDAERIKK